MDTLQKAVGEVRKELAQKKSEGQADGVPAANNSTPNLSPTGGVTAARDDTRPGREKLEFPLVNLAWFYSWFSSAVLCI